MKQTHWNWIGRSIAAAIIPLGALTTLVTAQNGPGPDDPVRRRSPVQRAPVEPAAPPDGQQPGPGPGHAHFPQEFRTIDGTSNNMTDPVRGSAGVKLLRQSQPDYADDVGAPAGSHRPGARLISELVAAQDADHPNPLGLSDFLWQWGQFLDHDVDETPIAEPSEPFDIIVPAGDSWFDPQGTGTVTIPLDRSAYVIVDDLRQQLNNITAYIDASNVYGSDPERALALRTLDGTGRLQTSEGDLLPFNLDGFDNAPDSTLQSLFLAGDIRANEQVGLTAMHTLFLREHNHQADQIRADHPQLTGDEVYEHARAIVAAEMQVITYEEFLPRLLGPDSLPPYTGYRPEVDAGIANLFATAAYRVGHTMLSSQLLRLDAQGDEAAEGHLDLASAFFNPEAITDGGIDSVLRGLAGQRAQDVDPLIIDDVRNFLFGAPGSGGFDLAALNIQRGRDHGLASYNQVRIDFGRQPVNDFEQVSPDPQVQANLAAAYDHVDDIDVWVGLLAEPHRPGAIVGETLYRILRDQFIRLRDGDRFWYQGYLPPPVRDMVEMQTLATIIRRNTTIDSELQDDVFVVADGHCPTDFNGDGTVDIGDMLAVLDRWGACNACPEDIDGDGVVGVSDLLELMTSWGSCQ